MKAAQQPGARITTLLELLYGRAVGECTARELVGLIARRAAIRNTPPAPGPLSERDALLITYADQVREDGIPSLRTLAAFCEKRLVGVVSGVHILPFYPWSSDDGFSVKDYFTVEPGYGTWEDIGVLGKRFDLMFDAVFNHLSAQGGWFQRFLRDEPQFRDFFVMV